MGWGHSIFTCFLFSRLRLLVCHHQLVIAAVSRTVVARLSDLGWGSELSILLCLFLQIFDLLAGAASLAYFYVCFYKYTTSLL